MCDRLAADFSADIDLAQSCLEGDETAIVGLQAETGAWLRATLVNLGAAVAEADEILTSLWSDCVCGIEGQSPRLTRYRGQCPLRGWLKVVAVNKLLDRKRREGRWKLVSQTLAADAVPEAESTVEAPLLIIMKEALTAALADCPSEALVMLQLIHFHRLTQRDLARMWGWSESTVSRTLAQASENIARRTLARIREIDPSLTLTWKDFSGLCQCADFSVFV